MAFRDKNAFREWIKHDHELREMRQGAKENLTLYVDGLITTIYDLKADIHRPYWNQS